MKKVTLTKTALALTALGISAWMITAQDAGTAQRPPRRQGAAGQGGDGPPGGPRRPPPPLIGALDANHDGVIDETEIANASNALRTLDKNGDGKLTMDELMPPRPEGGERPGRFRGPPPPDGEAPQAAK